MNKEAIKSSVLGLALGDAFGAPYEGGPIERLLWRLIGTSGGKKRWTDDTQMSLDTLRVLLKSGNIDQDKLATTYANSYKWSRGYGPGAAKLLKQIRSGVAWQTANQSIFKEGSYGNGGAMRAPIVGLFYHACEDKTIAKKARDCAEVTHRHPLGKEGAALVAVATALCCRGLCSDEIGIRLLEMGETEPYQQKLVLMQRWLLENAAVTPREVSKLLGNGIAAVESCITAIYVALRFRELSFHQLLKFVQKLKGDVDTIGAMSGAIWGASKKTSDLPEALIVQLESREYIEDLAHQLADYPLPLTEGGNLSAPLDS